MTTTQQLEALKHHLDAVSFSNSDVYEISIVLAEQAIQLSRLNDNIEKFLAQQIIKKT